MKDVIKKIIYLSIVVILLVGAVIFIISRMGSSNDDIKILTSNYIGYDFARAITGDGESVEMLMKPGSDIHSYEPTPEDIIKLQNTELFIYIGGESEEWVENLLENNEVPAEKTLRLMDFVDLLDEEIAKGMESPNGESEESEYDEHIWTSPVNAIKMMEAISGKLQELHPEQATRYINNSNDYIDKINQADREIRGIVNNSSSRELVFGDRFPFLYFVREYGLKYYAAFPGCSEQTEASSKTLAFLIDKIKEDNIKVILKIELTPDKIAQALASETGAKIMTLSAAHNISEEDYNNGVTYVDILNRNIEVLREAL